MHTRNFGSSSSASKVYSFGKIRTFIVKILIRFSNAYADLALLSKKTKRADKPQNNHARCRVLHP
jgi:hypothetical protein